MKRTSVGGSSVVLNILTATVASRQVAEVGNHDMHARRVRGGGWVGIPRSTTALPPSPLMLHCTRSFVSSPSGPTRRRSCQGMSLIFSRRKASATVLGIVLNLPSFHCPISRPSLFLVVWKEKLAGDSL